MAEIELHPPSDYIGEQLCPCCGAGSVTGWHYVNCIHPDYSHQQSCGIYLYMDRLCSSCEDHAPTEPTA